MKDFLQRQSQAMIVINLVLLKIGADLITTPQYTESDRGKKYTRNLLTDHHRRIFSMLRMRLEVFEILLNWLLKNTNLGSSR